MTPDEVEATERRETLGYFADGVEKLDEEIAGLRAALAEAQRERDEARRCAEQAEDELLLMRPAVEAAKRWRSGQPKQPNPEYFYADELVLIAAVDTYETQTGGTE